jgi:peptidoglycan/LPS O-acetylase OafA/YrhL
LCFLYSGKALGSFTPLFLSALLVLSPLLRFVAARHGWSGVAIQQQTQFRLDSIGSGVLMAFLYVVHPSIFARLLRLRWLWLAVTLGGCIYLASASRVAAYEEASVYTAASLTAVSFILFVYRSKVTRLLPSASNALAFLGIYSYSLYVWQRTGAHAASILQRHFGILAGTTWEVGLEYASAIVVAFIITRLIERPFMKLRDRLFSARSSPLMTVGVPRAAASAAAAP